MQNIDHIGQLKPDPKNARKHNPRNIGMIETALHEVGAARSIVIDEDGTILVGMCPSQDNHSVAQLKGSQGSAPSCDTASIIHWVQECNPFQRLADMGLEPRLVSDD